MGMMLLTTVLPWWLQGLLWVEPAGIGLLVHYPFSPSSWPQLPRGGAECPRQLHISVQTDMRKCASHSIPMDVMICVSPRAKHRYNCKFTSLSTNFIMTLVTVKHILMTVALRTLARFWKYLLKTAAAQVALGSVGSESPWPAIHIITRPGSRGRRHGLVTAQSPRQQRKSSSSWSGFVSLFLFFISRWYVEPEV